MSEAADLMWRDALNQRPDQQQVAFASRFYRYLSDEEMSGHEVPTKVDDLVAMRAWVIDLELSAFVRGAGKWRGRER